MAYCSPSDLYQHGLTRGALPNPGRVAGAVYPASDEIELDVHGFADGDPVSFRAGASGSLPSPLVAGTTYYAIESSESRFQVASSSGGAAISLTTAGSGVVVIAPLPIDNAIAWADRVIDDMLPAHVVPLESPYPEIIRFTSAELAAGKLLALTGGESRQLSEIVDGARARLERWARHVPVRGENAPRPAQLAQSASRSSRDSRGWARFGGL